MKNGKANLFVMIVLLACIFSMRPVLGQTQLDLNISAATELQTADAQLNVVYAEILRLYANNPLFIKNIRVAQRAWLKFRDAELGALYPTRQSEDQRDLYGSVFPMCFNNTKSKLTRARTEQLLMWIKGVEDGEVCSGSVKLASDIKKQGVSSAENSRP